MTQGEERALESPEANSFDGTVKNGLYISVASVFVIVLVVFGLYLAFKKTRSKKKVVNSAKKSVAEVEGTDGASSQSGASQNLEMSVTATPAITVRAE